MDTICTETIIRAPIKAVWRALITLVVWSKYSPSYSPFVFRVIEILKRDPSGPAILEKKRAFHSKITEVIEYEKLKWKSRAGPIGLLNVEHSFQLESLDEFSTRFTHKQTFSGWLTPVFFDQIEDRVEKSFESINFALKRPIEKL